MIPHKMLKKYSLTKNDWEIWHSQGMLAGHNIASYIFKGGFYFMAIILPTFMIIPPHSEPSTA
jgi:hypothetical protein